MADKGIRVIPTVNWGLENTFDFCFNGIEKGSTVAVSTYMASAHKNRAIKERQFTDHSRPKYHSNPHDVSIEWNKKTGTPIWGKDINYFDGNIPEFKYYKITGGYDMSIKYANPDYNEDYKTKYEFKDSVMRHAEIVFEWKNVEYEICSLDGKKWLFCNHKDDFDDIFYDNIDDVMNHKIGDDRLIDICTKFTVIERTF